MRHIQENIFQYLLSWLIEVGGGAIVNFGTFDGQEGATKIKQVWTREEFWSLDDKVTIECPSPMKCLYHQENQKIHQKFQHLLKVNPILLANSWTSGQYTNSWPSPVSLRVTTHRPVTFAVGRLNLHWRNSDSIINK